MDVEVDLAGGVQVNDLFLVLTIKRRLSVEQKVEDDSQTENITFFVIPLIILQIDNLRRHEPWGTASGEKLLLLLDKSGQAEIDDAVLGVLLSGLADDVLRLDVTVHDAL